VISPKPTAAGEVTMGLRNRARYDWPLILELVDGGA